MESSRKYQGRNLARLEIPRMQKKLPPLYGIRFRKAQLKPQNLTLDPGASVNTLTVHRDLSVRRISRVTNLPRVNSIDVVSNSTRGLIKAFAASPDGGKNSDKVE